MKKSIVLASSSPRRRELLKNLKVDFEIVPSKIDEKITVDLSPDKWAMELARQKALDVSSRYGSGFIIVGADTLVTFGDKILEKPEDKEEAREMLSIMSGEKHRVITGVCLVDTTVQKVLTDMEITEVWFKELTSFELERYIKQGEWIDKAGGYGIQGLGALFVEKIYGCYNNVVGLPLFKLSQMFKEVGIYW